MADALCGPSNALQSFQKHAQVDRTLQQDRLTGPRHSPVQGFRTPDPRAGSLDAEFAAFEAGPPNPFQFEQHLPYHTGFPSFAGSPGPSNWANDFQKLNFSQPLPSRQFHTEAPLVRTGGGNWHTEFMRQRQGGGSSVMQEKQAVRQSPAYGFDMSSQLNMMGWSHGEQASHEVPMAEAQLQHEGEFSQVNFESAFDGAFRDAEMLNADQTQAQSHINATHSEMLHDDGVYTNDHSLTTPLTISHDTPTLRIGSDAITYTEVVDRNPDQDTRDADALARTAGQLLSAVQHDTSAKFQGSQFMALMRKIRDREVEVRDEDFKSTTPDNTSASAVQQTAYRTEIASPLESQYPTTTISDLRPHDPNTFAFPDLNEVYQPEPQNQHDQMNIDSQPQTQMQALHPGGPWYPEQSPPPESAHQMMSGAISAEEFERLDESGNLGRRYQRPSVVDATD